MQIDECSFNEGPFLVYKWNKLGAEEDQPIIYTSSRNNYRAVSYVKNIYFYIKKEW